ncbi:hypothetical protein MBGDF03_00157 [Thermoplasmatales archaeon SCGC AB-540-F20]|nr:hypothetical protein MBGDF03_00157 [Thermoplasmatales archaeon SCGC AB-540-F20]
MNIITLNDLSKAIVNRLGVDEKEAQRVAGFILDLFGYEDRIIDNILDIEDRQLFYMLEEEGMLISGREETILYNGREWLTHYWQLNRNTILKYAKNGGKRSRSTHSTKKQTMEMSKENNIYSSLSKDMWSARKINRKKPICYFLTSEDEYGPTGVRGFHSCCFERKKPFFWLFVLTVVNRPHFTLFFFFFSVSPYHFLCEEVEMYE